MAPMFSGYKQLRFVSTSLVSSSPAVLRQTFSPYREPICDALEEHFRHDDCSYSAVVYGGGRGMESKTVRLLMPALPSLLRTSSSYSWVQTKQIVSLLIQVACWNSQVLFDRIGPVSDCFCEIIGKRLGCLAILGAEISMS
ncbi:hypothetical protein Nepgr_002358 [Nepenthes gracilis]|uniref:Uncharacterized protein n=1 Tax=Nepenthes gracilis TaxID=150966 RepID=A0AAD3P9K2_NEPGR|nr:hypothetical protein Nepgr_002358 [Nepenthes gracilis]